MVKTVFLFIQPGFAWLGFEHCKFATGKTKQRRGSMKLSPLEVACCAAIAIVITVTWLHSCEGKKPSESKSVKTVVVEAPMEMPARKVGWATIAAIGRHTRSGKCIYIAWLTFYPDIFCSKAAARVYIRHHICYRIAAYGQSIH